ncbi:MAG: type IV pilus modification protein PilV [Pseudomonas sp.]
MKQRSGNAGFTLIEILVALVIFLVSVLGIAGLVTRTLQQETESYQRVQALILLQDMVDRLNANRQVATCYSNAATGRTLGTDFDASSLACGSGTAAQQAQALDDLQQWDNLLKGSAEQSATDNSNVGAVIGARGCIRLVDAGQRIYRITVAWQGMGETVAPSNTCGQNSYGNEALRRTVSAVVRIGALS